MKILGVILARGGSKSITKKSIAICAGKPLMWYTINAANKSKLIDRLIISTDDQEMADYAQKEGVEVPFMRPKELAEDDTPDLSVFKHLLNELKRSEGYIPDIVVHLRPTTPLKSAEDIDRGIQLICDDENIDSVRSVCEPLHTPFKMYTINNETNLLEPILTKEFPKLYKKHPEFFNLPRQMLPEIYRHSGYVDVIRTDVILNKNSMSGNKIRPLYFESWRDIDIDSEHDLKYAEFIINNKKII